MTQMQKRREFWIQLNSNGSIMSATEVSAYCEGTNPMIKDESHCVELREGERVFSKTELLNAFRNACGVICSDGKYDEVDYATLERELFPDEEK